MKQYIEMMECAMLNGDEIEWGSVRTFQGPLFSC